MMSDVYLKPYHLQHHKSLENYTISKGESDFALTPLKALNHLAESEDAVVIISNDAIAGFLRLNFNDDRYNLTDNPNAVLVKSFSITEKMQGQQIAQKALAILPHYIHHHYSDIDEIVLSVNKRNLKAIHVYEKCGFNDTGKEIGGRAGAQHVMSLSI